jgi:hypothetical protein
MKGSLGHLSKISSLYKPPIRVENSFTSYSIQEAERARGPPQTLVSDPRNHPRLGPTLCGSLTLPSGSCRWPGVHDQHPQWSSNEGLRRTLPWGSPTYSKNIVVSTLHNDDPHYRATYTSPY